MKDNIKMNWIHLAQERHEQKTSLGRPAERLRIILKWTGFIYFRENMNRRHHLEDQRIYEG
jgi:hypothetical protein